MKILLTGATGLIGKELGKKLASLGYSLIILTRNPIRARLDLPFRAEIYPWEPTSSIPPLEAYRNIEAIIHLAGESVAQGRWSNERKREIRDSRVLSTRNLLEGARKSRSKSLKKLIFASAIGFYGDRKGELLTEESRAGSGFLAEVCQDWEREMRNNPPAPVCIVRIGMVLSRQGGALKKLLPIFKAGFGGGLGDGEQKVSWIHIDDLISLFLQGLENPEYEGVFNGVSPSPVSQLEFSRSLAEALGERLFFKTPKTVIRLLYGEMGDLLFNDQKVIPQRAESKQFQFQYPKLEQAFRNLVAPIKDCEEFYAEQWIPQTPEKVFSFFSKAENLEEITPPWLHFKILNQSTSTLQTGTLIDYRLKIHGIPASWRTRIEDWSPPERFSDRQLKGPYSLWHHTHRFIPSQGGTLMTDQVFYRIPFGILGQLAGAVKVHSDIEMIFAYRREKIASLIP